ncbi:hypothetical protein ACP70R_043822 [Stipagrostis hirtigluma subsp. patula]
MSLRALRSFLPRRFSPRRIPHTLSDALLGTATVAASAGLIQLLCLDEDRAEEAAYMARFEDWMQRHGRRYMSEEQKDMRYEIFKETAKSADESNASRGRRDFAPTEFADWTHEELKVLNGTRLDQPFTEEEYIALLNTVEADRAKGITERAAAQARRDAARLYYSQRFVSENIVAREKRLKLDVDRTLQRTSSTQFRSARE